jgi:N-dimethylarginine dimethylaminohydrolase
MEAARLLSQLARLRERKWPRRVNPVSGYFSSTGSPNDGDITVIRGKSVFIGWAERSDTHQCRWMRRWLSLRSTHPAGLAIATDHQSS